MPQFGWLDTPYLIASPSGSLACILKENGWPSVMFTSPGMDSQTGGSFSLMTVKEKLWKSMPPRQSDTEILTQKVPISSFVGLPRVCSRSN